jgi:hypothetical protein
MKQEVRMHEVKLQEVKKQEVRLQKDRLQKVRLQEVRLNRLVNRRSGRATGGQTVYAYFDVFFFKFTCQRAHFCRTSKVCYINFLHNLPC